MDTYVPQFLLRGMSPVHRNCAVRTKSTSPITPILKSGDLYDVYKASDGRARCFCCDAQFEEDDWAFAAETGTCQYCHEDLILVAEVA